MQNGRIYPIRTILVKKDYWARIAFVVTSITTFLFPRRYNENNRYKEPKGGRHQWKMKK